MGLWTEEQIEAWVSPETRTMEMPDGCLRPMTFSVLTWSAYDDLIDTGYYSHRWLLEIAAGGWPLSNAPFELRFAWAVAFVHQERTKELGPFR